MKFFVLLLIALLASFALADQIETNISLEEKHIKVYNGLSSTYWYDMTQVGFGFIEGAYSVITANE
jgi:hypothetical protein